MRSDALCLDDIVQATAAIERFVTGMEEDRFVGDDLVRSAVMHKLTVIGEAATSDAPALKPEIGAIAANRA